MAKPRPKPAPPRAPKNQRRTRASFVETVSRANRKRRPVIAATGASFVETVSRANRRAHEKANRRTDRRGMKSVKAAIAAAGPEEEAPAIHWPGRFFRWGLALLLLPLCWVTSWTFLSRFAHATVHGEFWRTEEFWFFATGGLMMTGWFWSGLLRRPFLYLYVLGHELTHAAFVLMFRGKVTGFHVSADGGYITTNKTNWLIALSPYFVPFWSVVVVALFAVAKWSAEIPPVWDKAMYAWLGATWTFHMVWTLWMIPRDQPDLKDQGTLLSLVVIYFANLSLLVALLCLGDEAPLDSARDFGREWLRHAATWGDEIFRRMDGEVGKIRRIFEI